jgi:hypothetical protein
MHRIILTALLGLLIAQAAQAHLMVAQRGSLNIVDNGAYLVLSLPVSAFHGVDDNGDSQWSEMEIRAHQDEIEAQVRQGVQLIAGGRQLHLDGLLLTRSPHDHSPFAPTSQLVITGRFAPTDKRNELALKIALFGSSADEKLIEVTVTRKPQSQSLRFEPGHAEFLVLPAE